MKFVIHFSSFSLYYSLNIIAETLGTREQLAVAAFAQSMLIIPKTLATNGAYDSTELVAQLRSYHHAAQTNAANNKSSSTTNVSTSPTSSSSTAPSSSSYGWMGLNLDDGSVRDNLRNGVLEPAISKIKMIRFATEAAITILRIDDSIKMRPAEKPSGPQADNY